MKDNPYARLYREKFPHGDRLDEIKRLIKWDLFRPVLNGLFKDTNVGRPHVDVVLMAKMLFSRLAIKVPDYSTIDRRIRKLNVHPN